MIGSRKSFSQLPPEEKKAIIDDPGATWKEWAITRGLKPWIGLGLLVFDLLMFLSIWEVGGGVYEGAAFASLVLAVYSNFLVWMYLWHVPTPAEVRSGDFQRSPIHPFLVGRWTPEYDLWLKGQLIKIADNDLNPEEFL